MGIESVEMILPLFVCVSTGKQRLDRPDPSPLCALYCINLLPPFYSGSTMNIKHENHYRHIHPVRHAKHPKQILQTKHIYNKINRTTI